MILEKASGGDFRAIRAIYRESFPPEELMPWWLLRLTAGGRHAEVLAAREGGEIIGFAYSLLRADIVYFFFFAMEKDHRGQGYGSKILSEVQRRYAGRRIFLGRESLDPGAENYAQRLRRVAFYRRNGFHDLPERITEAGCSFDVMGTGDLVLPEEYDALINAWCGKLIRRAIGFRMELTEEASAR